MMEKQHFLMMGILCGTLAFTPVLSQAADYDEALQGDLSNDRLAPNLLTLSYGSVGTNGLAGNNILSGTLGRVNGIVDRDYVHIVVPTGYNLSELRVGNQTSVGGTTSFIGLAAGSIMPVDPSATSAAGLLGYRLYGAADLQQNILDDMAISGNGSSGFASQLDAGDYTLWIQELATGNFNYRFNLILTPVPEPETYTLLLVGLSSIGCMIRKKRNIKKPYK